ncbi:hypothetical protein PAPYR_8155 [Paratrimastix pyriformis]|uniref:Uncharacterized protein n=1 Tax=Paratrimastix pyriformis TaxID=342808 RepID=A0ABQ8UFX1_9EUKA|nr:hypothetical protein PAPYR_8155 [Paratrimastix pyriformis]
MDPREETWSEEWIQTTIPEVRISLKKVSSSKKRNSSLASPLITRSSHGCHPSSYQSSWVVPRFPFMPTFYYSVSHATRMAVKGTLRELSFVFDDPAGTVPILTADALAAIVGPCKGLVKLTLPKRKRTSHDDNHPAGTLWNYATPWVDEAFAGHGQLAVLSIPWAEPLLPAISHIFQHLPELMELHFLEIETFPPALLGTIAQSCPCLLTLRLSTESKEDLFLDLDSNSNLDLDFMQLSPLAAMLEELTLHIPFSQHSCDTLSGLIPQLVALERLDLFDGYDLTIARANQLTHVNLVDQVDNVGATLLSADGTSFCRMESLGVALGCQAEELLAASRGTLQSVKLITHGSGRIDRWMDLLGGLPRLTRLELTADDFCHPEPDDPFVDALPASLLNRLEHLVLQLYYPVPVAIASKSLRTLRISVDNDLTLDCPALEELDWVAGSDQSDLVINCPRLRTMKPELTGLRIQASMPDLVGVEFPAGAGSRIWHPLLDAAPRLAELVNVSVSQPALFDRLLSVGSLFRLGVHLPLAALPSPPALRLPGHLEHLDMFLSLPKNDETMGFINLPVEAPGLRSFTLNGTSSWPTPPPPVRLILSCPALVALRLSLPHIAAVLFGAAPPLLRSLRVDSPLSAHAASLLAILTEHGAHLRHVALLLKCPSGWEAWPRLLADALGHLPQLARLELLEGHPTNLALACPHLRQLLVVTHQWYSNPGPLSSTRSLLLICPLLEELQATFGRFLKRFELVGPVPNLRRIDGVGKHWTKHLKERFPDVVLGDLLESHESFTP